MAKVKERPERNSPPPYPELSTFVYYFNRFTLVKAEGWYIVYLGTELVGEVMDSQVIAISAADVTNCFKGSTGYITAIEAVSLAKPKEWDYPRSRKPVYVANVINLSRSGDVAEIAFVNYGIHENASIKNGLIRKPLTLKCEFTFRSNLETHRQLLGHLFDGLTVE